MKGKWSSAILVAMITLAGFVAAAEAQDWAASGQRTFSVDSSMAIFAKSPWLVLSEDSIGYPGHYVGIGKLNPAAALDVDSPNAQLILHDRAGGNGAAVLLEDTDATGEILNLSFARSNGAGFDLATIFMASDNSLAYQTGGTAHRFKISGSQEAMRITGTGFVGIGTPSPAHLLDVSNGVTTAFCDGTTWVNASSRAGKEGIRPFAEDDYQHIRRWLDEIEVVWYRYRNDKDPRTRVGLIAEDVPAVLATHDRQGISTADAIGFLTATSKQLASENDSLRRENEALLERLLKLEQRVDKVEHHRVDADAR